MDEGAPLVTRLLGQVVGFADANLTLAEWEDRGESNADLPIAPLHRHLEDDEVWYTLEGTLGFALDGAVSLAPTGTLVWVRPGIAHTYWNAGNGTARYPIIAPTRVFALIDQIHTTSGDRDALRKLFAAHASELLEPPS